MDVLALHRQGWKIVDIAARVGRHPETVSKWIKAGGPPARRVVVDTLIDVRWAERTAQLLAANPNLQATSVLRLLAAEGFAGSYPTVARHLRSVRGPRRGRAAAATVAIETPAGQEAQADWSDCDEWGLRWGLGRLQCFGAILAWSRQRLWWFAGSVDREHTFEGLVRFFEDVGGVPAVVRIDNMGALVARSHPRLVLHPPARQFAAAHGFTFAGCWPGDGARKGKVERPFRELKETFLQEVSLTPPTSIGELNRIAARWLAEVVAVRAHRVTGEPPADRWRREAPLLAPLPRIRYDTARREARRVGRIPLVEVDGARYSVPPLLAGQLVEVAVPPAAGVVQVRSGGQTVARHPVAAAGSEPVWDPAHRAEAERIALTRHQQPRRHLRAVDGDAGPDGPAGPALPPGDFDVDTPDLDARYGLDRRDG